MALATATQADMKNRYEHGTLGNLVKDDGSQATPSELTTNSLLATLLSEAEGRVRSVALRGGRYTSADLAALTGDSLEYYKGVICIVCFWLLWKRKPWLNDELRKSAKEEADEILKALGNGEEVFEVQAVLDAGKLTAKAFTRVEMQQDHALIRDVAHRFYPDRRTWQNR